MPTCPSASAPAPAPALVLLVCTRCQGEKPTEQFRPHSAYKTGFKTWCIACEREYNTDHARRNSVERARQKRERRRANPEKTKADRRRYHQMYRQKETEYMRLWRHKNRSYVNAWMRAWHKARNEGKPGELAFWLRRFADQKCCTGCRRLRPHLAFDMDRRTKDGLTAKCLDCLPARKQPKGGALSLDTVWECGGGGGGFILGDHVPDQHAASPETVAIQGELDQWISDSLTPRQKEFLEAFVGCSLCLASAAADIGASQDEAQELLGSIRSRAKGDFGSDYAD